VIVNIDERRIDEHVFVEAQIAAGFRTYIRKPLPRDPQGTPFRRTAGQERDPTAQRIALSHHFLFFQS
jgi:hypothetical protein